MKTFKKFIDEAHGLPSLKEIKELTSIINATVKNSVKDIVSAKSQNIIIKEMMKSKALKHKWENLSDNDRKKETSKMYYNTFLPSLIKELNIIKEKMRK